MEFTCGDLDNGGVVLPHKTLCLKFVSKFHIDISLLFCTLAITHDFSVG